MQNKKVEVFNFKLYQVIYDDQKEKLINDFEVIDEAYAENLALFHTSILRVNSR